MSNCCMSSLKSEPHCNSDPAGDRPDRLPSKHKHCEHNGVPLCQVHTKNEKTSGMVVLEATTGGNLEPPQSKKTEEFCVVNAHTDLDPCNCLDLEQPKKLFSDLDSHWIGVEKVEPWWHTTDKDKLASLVSQELYESIENCDLPQIQSKNSDRGLDTCIHCYGQDKLRTASTEAKICDNVDCVLENPSSISTHKTLDDAGMVECLLQQSDGTLSNSDSSVALKGELAETQPRINGDLSKAELLEALCHSQTRAREAEKLAQQAYDEKEHIFNLFFRQASYLFAYRQWLQILQLETLYLQLESKKDPSSKQSQDSSPIEQSKGMALKRNSRRATKTKPAKNCCQISRSAVVFAVGLSLAGAGLLVGWTIGWLLPSF